MPSRTPHRSIEWWKSYFDQGYLNEYSPLFNEQEDRAQVSRILDLLELPAGSRILDLACGQGRHAQLLAEAGHQVDGYDLSKELLAEAKRRRGGRNPHYTRGDMRRLPLRWRRRFDAVLNLFTSFGFFDDPADDAKVMVQCARVLKPGGVMLWQGGSRDGVMAKFLSRDGWEATDGTIVVQDRSFDPLSGFLTIRSTWQSRRKTEHREHRIRLYTATHLAELMRAAGLVVEQAWDSFTDGPLTRRSSEMLLVARREA